MAEKVKQKDFVELDFTATTPDGIIFDTTSQTEAKKAELNIKEVKPLALAIGSNMIIPGLDKSLEGKELNKEYKETFEPEQAFGKRNPQLIKMVPLKAFIEQKIQPQRGLTLSLDGRFAKIISVSGGRVLVDFNNPLSGKQVTYKFKINKKITDPKEKINSLQDYFFKQRFDFDTKDKKIIFKTEDKIKPLIEMMAKPFEDILGIKVEAELLAKDKKDKSSLVESEQKVKEPKVEEKKEEVKEKEKDFLKKSSQ